jgi:hypothetical protein
MLEVMVSVADENQIAGICWQLGGDLRALNYFYIRKLFFLNTPMQMFIPAVTLSAAIISLRAADISRDSPSNRTINILIVASSASRNTSLIPGAGWSLSGLAVADVAKLDGGVGVAAITHEQQAARRMRLRCLNMMLI